MVASQSFHAHLLSTPPKQEVVPFLPIFHPPPSASSTSFSSTSHISLSLHSAGTTLSFHDSLTAHPSSSLDTFLVLLITSLPSRDLNSPSRCTKNHVHLLQTLLLQSMLAIWPPPHWHNRFAEHLHSVHNGHPDPPSLYSYSPSHADPSVFIAPVKLIAN